MAKQLSVVITDTEQATLGLAEKVQALTQLANSLVGYLGSSAESARDIERNIEGSSDSIVAIAGFVNQLPAMIRDNQNVAVQQIGSLRGIVGVIKGISQQTNFLALNASIVAATAGDAGLSFGVVAGEIRSLSEKATAAAAMIERGLADAETGLSLAGVDAQIGQALETLKSIQQLQEGNGGMRAFYQQTIDVVAEHSRTLAADLSTMLGQLQYQDIVRQRLERASGSLELRTRLLAGLSEAIWQPAALDALAQELGQACESYNELEGNHATFSAKEDSLPAIELF